MFIVSTIISFLKLLFCVGSGTAIGIVIGFICGDFLGRIRFMRNMLFPMIILGGVLFGGIGGLLYTKIGVSISITLK